MTTRWQRAVVAAVVASGLVWGQDAAQERFLLNAEIVKSKAAPGGVTNSKRVTMSDGITTHDAHIQCIDEFKQTNVLAGVTKINFIDSYRGNIAAFKLDRMMGLNMIPVTVERKVGGNTAAITWWVDNVKTREMERQKNKLDPPNAASWNQQYTRMRVFDELIGNTDRNQGNILILDNWDIVLIDHTRAFDYSPDLAKKASLRQCDRDLLAAMKRLNKADLKRELGRWLRDIQITSLLLRRDKLVAHFEKLIAERGEKAVLYGGTTAEIAVNQ